MRLDEAHHYDLEVHDGEAVVIARIGPLRQSVARTRVPPGVGAHGPDTIAFSVRTGDADLLPAELDGRYLSTEAAGFTGRVIGMYVEAASTADR